MDAIQCMYTVQIVPRTDKVCTLYRLYQGQTRYLRYTDCTKDKQGMSIVQIVSMTDKVCTLYRLYQGPTSYERYTDCTNNR